jgi:hypothetical protein
MPTTNTHTNVQKVTFATDGSGIVMPKTSGIGLKVDPAAETYPWRDITSDIIERGANSPTLAVYRGGIYQYQHAYNVAKETYHIVDMHYQSTGMGTKNKAPNFYGA